MTSKAFDPAIDDLQIASRREIVFIEDNVADYQTIAANAGAGRQVVILDSSRDGLQQIADAVKGMSGIDALHVVTHGAEGRIGLGTLTLDEASAAQHTDLLASVGASMAAGGDILFYGCSVGAGQGAGLLTQLAIATGADVAASNDATGDPSQGGDWNLEVRSGSIEAAAFVDPALAEQYHALLNIPGPTTITFTAAPHAGASGGQSTNLAYSMPGSPGYTLNFEGHREDVWSYGTSYSPNAYVSLSPYSTEDEITIGFSGGQIFTLGSVKVNANASIDQTLIFTGLKADGTEVTHANVFVPAGATIADFVTQALNGFTNISTLVITPQAGKTIQYFQMDDLVLTNVQQPPPHVASVSSTNPNGTYKIGDTINIQVDFDKPVDVTGTPQLTLETGATDRTINYVGGTGTSELTFQYIVQAGDLAPDLDYKNSAIALNGGTIKAHMSTQDADVTLYAPGTGGSLASNKAIVIDGVVPTMAITSNKSVLKAGDTANITFTFSEAPGASFSASDITVIGGAIGAIGGTGLTRTAVFTPTAGVNGGTASISVGAGTFNDIAGNTNIAVSNGPAITYDTLAPAVTIGSDKTVLKLGETAVITFSFSEDPGSSFIASDVTVTGGALGAISGSGTTRTAVFTPVAGANSGTASISVNANTYNDTAGNNNAGASNGPAISYDTLAPTLAITSSKAALKGGETATITFTFSEDPGASFIGSDVAVTGGTLGAISGSGTTRTAIFTPDAGVDSGTASITLAGAYTDAAGNAGSGGATPAITYDTLAPAAPSAPDLDGNHDSGASSTDDLTNDTTTAFSGSGENGATVRLYDGATEIGSGTVSGGTWTIPVNGLAEGSHTLTAKAVDAAGNASAASGALNLVVDRTPPSTAVSAAQLSDDTGSSATDMVASNGTQAISGTLGANLAEGEQVMVSTNNGATWTAATASAGTNVWSLPTTTLGASGVLQVRVVDAAGNAGASYTHAYTIDTTPPAAPSTPDLDTGSDSGSSNADDITGVTQPVFSGSAEIGATVRLFDGATEIGRATATDGTWHITSDTPLDPGSHTITAKATDVAGNVSGASPGLAVQVITGGPSTTITAMSLSSDSGVAGDFITNEHTQTIAGTLSSVLAAGERVQVSLNQGASWSDAASAAGSDTWWFAATLTEGAHEIRVRVLDAVDNPGPVLVQDYTLDTTPPALVIGSDASALKAGETATITFTFSEDPGASFTWDGSAGSVSVSGGALSAISGTGVVRTASFTPTAGTNGGAASISVDAHAYHDVAGNDGAANTTLALSYDTLAPDGPSAPDLDKDSDSGVLDTDNLTRETALVFSGSAEAGATVRLYDSDGVTEIGHDTAAGGTWHITTSALLDGVHTVTARTVDAAGNASAASGAVTVTVDTAGPATPAAPTLTIASDSGAVGDGITRVATPTFSGSAEVFATVTLYDGATLIDSIQADAAGAWHITAGSLLDGVHAITARQADRAGNASAAGAVFNLTVDTAPPAAPGAPALRAASDTGTIGDGITENDQPVIEGTALANTLVTLYDTLAKGKVKVGTAMADGTGKWSVATTGLGYGTHALSATQSDAAGNESAASAAFTLRIDAPPVLVNLIDGVAVDIHPISLPGGVIGSAVAIPIVSSGRVESSGAAGVADIPLATSGSGANLLLAQVAPGYGLSASGASVPVANAGELLIAAIKAATPAHPASDQGHLTSNGQSFLAGLGTGGSLLVETVKPVSAAAPAGVLTLSGPAAGAGQGTALVIDAGGLAAGATIALQHVDFAAVIGAANVVAHGSMVLSGDAASQHFTVTEGASGSVFAGGGNDILSIAPAAGATLLHGGAASDAATFSGARADYSLEFHNGYVVVSSKLAPALKTMVVNVEQLQFSDASVAVESGADMATLAGMYQSVLGRQADVMGIEYWANVHQAGASWGAIALTMIASNEHAASHEGFNGVAAHDIGLLYTAIFNRDADAAGLAWWTAAMGRGASLEQIASSFVESVEMVGHQRAALDWDFTMG
jgi:hypothetical protein